MDGMVVSALTGLFALILGLIVIYLTPPGDHAADRRKPQP
jgi:Na+/H+-dicarboxylate symporter